MNDFTLPGHDTSTFDDLFLERLDAFTEKTLADIRSFSLRENIPYDQVGFGTLSFYAHLKQDLLLRFGVTLQKDTPSIFSVVQFLRQSVGRKVRSGVPIMSIHTQVGCDWIVAVKVHNILSSTCQVLESLQVTAGVQSFVVAVNPNDADDEGFLGGSSLGKEFWTSLRGGGTAGAKALKSLAISTSQDLSSPSTSTLHVAGMPSRQRETAHSLKSEVYARVRTLLRRVCDSFRPLRWLMVCRHNRTTSGIRQAEMKWTNHGNLSVYGVRLEGWPSSIPMQNPSTLSSSQNRALRDALSNGTLKFCRINTEPSTSSVAGEASYGPAGSLSDLSWVISEGYDAPVRSFPLLRTGYSCLIRYVLNLRGILSDIARIQPIIL